MKPTFGTKISKKRSKTDTTDVPNAVALNFPLTCCQRWRHLKATQGSCTEAENQVHHASKLVQEASEKKKQHARCTDLALTSRCKARTLTPYSNELNRES
jgi:altronate dehydratase